MLELMLIEVFVKAFVLCGLLYLIAKHEADYGFQKVAMVTAGLALGSVLIDATVAPHLGPWTAIVHVAFIAFMLMSFCWISLGKTLIVVVLFSGVHFAIAFGAAAAASYVIRESSETGLVAMGATEEEFKELQEAIFGTGEPAATDVKADADAGADRVPEETVAPPDEEPPPPSEPQAAPPLEPTHAFAVEGAEDDPGWRAARQTLAVSGTLVAANGIRMAMIDGRMKEEGEVIAVVNGGQRYRWRIASVTESGVELRPLSVHPAER